MQYRFALLSRTVLIRRVLWLSLAFFACSIVASAQTWSLTNDQRRAYLNYYAPIILKRADENNNKQGRDWITNFDFDQDGNFGLGGAHAQAALEATS